MQKNNNDLKRRLIAAFPVASWPKWAIYIAVDKDQRAYAFGVAEPVKNCWGRPSKHIGDFIFVHSEDWRETLTTREEAQQISRPEFPDDWQRVIVTTERDKDELIQIVGYRYEGMWFECRLDGDEIFGNPVIDWQYLPKTQINEQ